MIMKQKTMKLKENKNKMKPKVKILEFLRTVDDFETLEFVDKTNQGWKIVKLFRDLNDNRVHVIAYREPTKDYIVGLGYDVDKGYWNQGWYDFKDLETAEQRLRDRYDVTLISKEKLEKHSKSKKGNSIKENKKSLKEGTNNFATMSRFPLLAFVTTDEVEYEVEDDEYKTDSDFVVLDDFDLEELEEDIDKFNSKIYYDYDFDYPVEIKPGYYQGGQLYVDGEKYLIEDASEEILKLYDDFFKEMGKKYGLMDLEVSARFDSGETWYKLKESKFNFFKDKKPTIKEKKRKVIESHKSIKENKKQVKESYLQDIERFERKHKFNKEEKAVFENILDCLSYGYSKGYCNKLFIEDDRFNELWELGREFLGNYKDLKEKLKGNSIKENKKSLKESNSKISNAVYNYFENSSWDFMHIVEDLLDGVETLLEEGNNLDDAIDYALNNYFIYEYQYWEMMKNYQSAQEANFESAFEEFINDLTVLARDLFGDTYFQEKLKGKSIKENKHKKGAVVKVKKSIKENVNMRDLLVAVEDAYGYKGKKARDYIKTLDEKSKEELVKGFKSNAKKSLLADNLKDGKVIKKPLNKKLKEEKTNLKQERISKALKLKQKGKSIKESLNTKKPTLKAYNFELLTPSDIGLAKKYNLTEGLKTSENDNYLVGTEENLKKFATDCLNKKIFTEDLEDIKDIEKPVVENTTFVVEDEQKENIKKWVIDTVEDAKKSTSGGFGTLNYTLPNGYALSIKFEEGFDDEDESRHLIKLQGDLGSALTLALVVEGSEHDYDIWAKPWVSTDEDIEGGVGIEDDKDFIEQLVDSIIARYEDYVNNFNIKDITTGELEYKDDVVEIDTPLEATFKDFTPSEEAKETFDIIVKNDLWDSFCFALEDIEEELTDDRINDILANNSEWALQLVGLKEE